jgi:tetratricopeptide (TPR) repeat protein
MKDIKAFVGHSFTDDDAQVVATFLKYFDQLSQLHSTFTWEHAEKAEPKVLTEKVLRIISDKNTFIGICTRKEQAVADSSLSNVMLQPLYAKARKADFRSKTSDWIIQEIGMAIGRGLELILLVEEGVSDPGGLQGDVEYIRFERRSPEKSFGKILEMITALSPKGAVDQTTAPDTSPSEQKAPPKNDLGEEFNTPTPSWTRDDYESAITYLTILKDDAGIQRVNQTYLATTDSSVGDNVITWQAHMEFARLYLGNGGNLDRLKQLSDDNPKNDKILSYLARVYSMFGMYKEAAEKFAAAANSTPDVEKQAQYLKSAAQACAAKGDFSQATSLAEAIRSTVRSAPGNEITLLQTLRDIYEYEKNEDAEIAALERIVEIKPDDFTSRFTLAYKHSGRDNADLALHHYLQIPFQKRTAIAWNNLGVSFSEFNLREKAVKAYQRSEAMGETLAMSNLGSQLMGAGFTEEAKEKCVKALAHENPHKNVSQLLAKLTSLPDEEDQKQEEVLKNSKPKIDFYIQLGRASTSAEPTSIATRWQSSDCVLAFAREGRIITLKGTYERDANPLAGLLGNLGSAAKRERFRVQYTATINGRAFFGSVKREGEKGASSAATSLLSELSTKVLMIVSDDGKDLSVMENPHSSNPTFYILKIVE